MKVLLENYLEILAPYGNEFNKLSSHAGNPLFAFVSEESKRRIDGAGDGKY